MCCFQAHTIKDIIERPFFLNLNSFLLQKPYHEQVKSKNLHLKKNLKLKNLDIFHAG